MEYYAVIRESYLMPKGTDGLRNVRFHYFQNAHIIVLFNPLKNLSCHLTTIIFCYHLKGWWIYNHASPLTMIKRSGKGHWVPLDFSPSTFSIRFSLRDFPSQTLTMFHFSPLYTLICCWNVKEGNVELFSFLSSVYYLVQLYVHSFCSDIHV